MSMGIITKYARITSVAICLSSIAVAQAPTFKPARGYVPDQLTAIAIAEVVLKPVYGEEQIRGERPFHAELYGDTWTISGSLPQGFVGGVATVRLSRIDGRILYMMHGK
jgi:hypothetical protein